MGASHSTMATTVVFRCAQCRVWTGEGHLLASTSVACDENELQTISGAVRVEWQPSRRAIRLYCEAEADQQAQRVLTIEEDSVRTIDVYCPSPFSMTVIVQVEVSSTIQQCFLLGRVSTADGDATVPIDHVLRLNDRPRMIAFLAALHDHLKEVPLSSAARELLAQKRTAESTTLLGSKAKGLKRRRTLSPMAFYGRASKTPVLTSPSSLQPSDGWATFYERLQYNVSHSLMCQLEGTAPLSASFPRQQEAFEFMDQVFVFRERLAEQRALSGECETRLPNVLDEPRVFCFEGAYEGKRRFWVTTLSAFWREYTAIPEGSRHVYEIIREGVPCRLYFDLEFKKKLNPQVDGDMLVDRLISLVQLQIFRMYSLRVDRKEHVVQLESSTSDKFSRHLTIHFPNDELFTDNIHAGAFVRQLVHDLITSDEDEKSPFLVRDSSADGEQHQLFIDVGVYTRNRMFRVLGSSKYRKTAVLRPLGIDLEGASGLDHDLFLRSIVCPRGTRDTTSRLLRCDDAVSLKRYGASSTSGGFHQPQMRSVESRTSIYPALDAFIRSIATTGGPQGEVRAVHLLFADSTLLPSDDPLMKHEPAKIVFHMMKNRWCENIGRPHKSNNVMFVVDVARREYVQRCHDPHCQAMDYRSPARPLPQHIELRSARDQL